MRYRSEILGIISANNMDSHANFVKLACLEVAFLKIGISVCNLQTRSGMSKFFFILCLRMGTNKWLKVSLSYLFEISGGMPLSCQKRQIPLTDESYFDKKSFTSCWRSTYIHLIFPNHYSRLKAYTKTESLKNEKLDQNRDFERHS